MNLPLEKFFARKATAFPSALPIMSNNYVLQYEGFLNYLRVNLYPGIDVGLAANSDESGFYTAHNGEHFDEVVRFAGKLLGIETGDEDLALIDLSPYELYILLMAIRIHDVGNIEGRERHEQRCFKVLKDSGAASGADDTEKKIIARIAQAHGGRTTAGSRDTIGAIPITTEGSSSFSLR